MLAPIVLLSVLSGLCYAVPYWDYEYQTGPNKWPELFEACNHGKQSPVNIETANVRYSSALTAFEMEGYDSIPPHSSWSIENNGKTVVVTLQGNYMISEGGLPNKFKAAQFHFHWGSYDQQGAEHGIDGVFAPAELHIVHYNTKYPSLAEAADKADGLAVLGFLYQPGNLDNPSYNHLFNHLENITYPNDKVDFRPIPLLSLLPSNLNNYYRYQGSLTTPPCYESVTWTVFMDKVEISKRQLRKFRTSLSSIRLDDEKRNLVNNYRPVQPLNDRLVLSSNPDDATIFTSPLSSPISITIAAFIGVVAVLAFFRR